MDNAIEIRGLVKHYGKFQLGPVDLTVPSGAIYGLIGPNGAGKTTTIDMIFGMGRNDAGQIRVRGFDHRADEVELKRRAAYVFPTPGGPCKIRFFRRSISARIWSSFARSMNSSEAASSAE